MGNYVNIMYYSETEQLEDIVVESLIVPENSHIILSYPEYMERMERQSRGTISDVLNDIARSNVNASKVWQRIKVCEIDHAKFKKVIGNKSYVKHRITGNAHGLGVIEKLDEPMKFLPDKNEMFLDTVAGVYDISDASYFVVIPFLLKK